MTEAQQRIRLTHKVPDVRPNLFSTPKRELSAQPLQSTTSDTQIAATDLGPQAANCSPSCCFIRTIALCGLRFAGVTLNVPVHRDTRVRVSHECLRRRHACALAVNYARNRTIKAASPTERPSGSSAKNAASRRCSPLDWVPRGTQ